jgi:hypothetical protein
MRKGRFIRRGRSNDSITCECNNCVDEEIKTVSARHAEAFEALVEHLFVLSSKLVVSPCDNWGLAASAANVPVINATALLAFCYPDPSCPFRAHADPPSIFGTPQRIVASPNGLAR